MTALTAPQRRALLALAQPTAAGHRDAGVTAIATHHSHPVLVQHTTIEALIARKLVTWRQLSPGVWRFYLTEAGVEIARQIAD